MAILTREELRTIFGSDGILDKSEYYDFLDSLLLPEDGSLYPEGGLIETGKVYRATLTQAGTAAPVAVVHLNTLGGTVVWTRNSAGNYTGTLSGAFITDKTWIMCKLDNGMAGSLTDHYVADCKRLNDNAVSLVCASISQAFEWAYADLFGGYKCMLEIRTYP